MKSLTKIALVSTFALCGCKDSKTVNHRPSAENAKKVEDAISGVREARLKELNETGALGSGVDQLDDLLDATKEASKGDGVEAKAYRITQKNLKKMKVQLGKYQKHQEGLEAIVDYSTLKKEKDFKERNQKLNDCIGANITLKDFIVNKYFSNIEKDIAASDLPKKAKREYLNAVNSKKSEQIKYNKIIRNEEIKMLKGFQEQLTLLEDNFDQWEWNESTESIDIKSDDLLEKFNAVVNGIQEAAKKQGVAQRAILQTI